MEAQAQLRTRDDCDNSLMQPSLLVVPRSDRSVCCTAPLGDPGGFLYLVVWVLLCLISTKLVRAEPQVCLLCLVLAQAELSETRECSSDVMVWKAANAATQTHLPSCFLAATTIPLAKTITWSSSRSKGKEICSVQNKVIVRCEGPTQLPGNHDLGPTLPPAVLAWGGLGLLNVQQMLT